ncbi:MAG: tRNA (guanosine(37)-N1)-methyltransferase TrmD [Myxococcales bacterium]|nr:tRNA (guanosine(37)-N1)-methyltransferase TrmD [Myxococcales bacterium]
MRIDVLTLFPGLIHPILTGSVLGRALSANVWSLATHDIRDHGLGRHRGVDDAPFGGGSGMVLRVDVVAAALRALPETDSPPHVVLLEASGQRFDHAAATRLASLPRLVFICGHYEGVDARVREHLADEALSIGDFVLTGGELAACVIIDAVVRLLPGALGNAHSADDESYANGRLEYPHYTRPRVWEGHPVPELLCSGDHARVAAWRQHQSDARTFAWRPDLAAAAGLRDPAVVQAEAETAAAAKRARRRP